MNHERRTLLATTTTEPAMFIDTVRASFPIGSTCIVRDVISPITGERAELRGLRVEVTGHDGMVGSIIARVVGSVDEVVETLSSRDGWWTRDRIDEIVLHVEVEFEPEELDRA